MAYRKALETITDLNDCIVKLETKHQESLEQERRGYEYENRKRAIKVAATQGMLAAALDILEKV